MDCKSLGEPHLPCVSARGTRMCRVSFQEAEPGPREGDMYHEGEQLFWRWKERD